MQELRGGLKPWGIAASLPCACRGSAVTCVCVPLALPPAQWNTGAEAYRRTELGPELTIVRKINLPSGGSLEVQDCTGRTVSAERERVASDGLPAGAERQVGDSVSAPIPDT